ncbi:MAG: hypothetical protein V1929_10750 [bacterium]
MKQTNRWMRPGWPWELEMLSLLFVLAAIVIPLYVAYLSEPAPVPTLLQQATGSTGTSTLLHFVHPHDVAWSIALLALFGGLIAVSRRGADVVSTPFVHLIAPLFFSFATYYRLYEIPQSTDTAIAIVSSSTGQVIAWAAGVIAIILLVARLCMARYAISFRDVTWDLSTPARRDSSILRLAPRILPLIYEPRTYRACDEGIVVEGRFYIMVIPFNLVQSISETSQPERLPSGQYFVRSVTRLIRIQVTSWPHPFFIAPRDHEEFFTYCNQRVRRIHRQTTLAGLATVHDVTSEQAPGVAE